jgi:hypothetical protein
MLRHFGLLDHDRDIGSAGTIARRPQRAAHAAKVYEMVVSVPARRVAGEPTALIGKTGDRCAASSARHQQHSSRPHQANL